MPLARLVTALQPHLAEPMTTHEFIDEDADLACQDLSDWESIFLQKLGIKPITIMEMNQTKKMGKKKKKQRKK